MCLPWFLRSCPSLLWILPSESFPSSPPFGGAIGSMTFFDLFKLCFGSTPASLTDQPFDESGDKGITAQVTAARADSVTSQSQFGSPECSPSKSNPPPSPSTKATSWISSTMPRAKTEGKKPLANPAPVIGSKVSKARPQPKPAALHSSLGGRAGISSSSKSSAASSPGSYFLLPQQHRTYIRPRWRA